MLNCYQSLIVGIICILTILPIQILFWKHMKKKGFCDFLKSKKSYLLFSMTVLDLYVALTNLVETNYFGWFFSSSQLLIMWMLRGFAVYMVIFFVFKKASKLHMNKYKWLFALKVMFSVSMIVIFCLGLYKLLGANNNNSNV